MGYCINMAKKTFMRVDQDLLNKLKAKKIAQRESYADVVKRMIDNEVRSKPLHKSEYARKKTIPLGRCQYCGDVTRLYRKKTFTGDTYVCKECASRWNIGLLAEKW